MFNMDSLWDIENDAVEAAPIAPNDDRGQLIPITIPESEAAGETLLIRVAC